MNTDNGYDDDDVDVDVDDGGDDDCSDGGDNDDACLSRQS